MTKDHSPVRRKHPKNMNELAEIKLAAFDIDGILTNGIKYYGEDGITRKGFHVRDGVGMILLKRAGIQVVLITADQQELVEKRARDLDVELFVTVDKAKIIREMKLASGITKQQILYMGDDLWDIPAFHEAQFAVSVPEAPATVKRHANWITKNPGGHGAVREVADAILESLQVDVLKLLEIPNAQIRINRP